MKRKLIIVFIVISVFLIGCELGNVNRPITDVDLRKGVEGLTMKFTQNAPPDRVFENDDFPMAVELKNKGASDIEKGIVVFGFEKSYVDLSGMGKSCTEDKVEECVDGSTVVTGLCENEVLMGTGNVCRIEIEGKSVFNPTGDEEFITINAQAKKIGEQSETHRSTILATACYPYKTVFGNSVCIDTDVYGMVKRQKACTVQNRVFGDGQGAPVAVTKIETRMLPYTNENDVAGVKPHFMIYIKNKGNGEVVDLNKVETACTKDPLAYTDFNNITINATLSGISLDCRVNKDKPKVGVEPDVVRLRDKEAIVRCTYGEGEDVIKSNIDAYTAPLRIDLDYGYTFTISKNIIIEKILTY